MKAATYPKNRVGCHSHALGALGDAVVVGWAGLKRGK
jgi:trehalose/maltose hydrolase-like predicted phosphorylase